jgi:hypothetical protein
MSCEHLICAQCAGPVAEGRCAVCRSARAELHSHAPNWTMPTAAIIGVLLLLLLALALTQSYH